MNGMGDCSWLSMCGDEVMTGFSKPELCDKFTSPELTTAKAIWGYN